jgi:hypothetical protein
MPAIIFRYDLSTGSRVADTVTLAVAGVEEVEGGWPSAAAGCCALHTAGSKIDIHRAAKAQRSIVAGKVIMAAWYADAAG